MFDIEKDPHEVNNLAAEPEYKAVLEDLRGRLGEKMESINDLSLFSENQMIDLALENGTAFGQARSGEIEDLPDDLLNFLVALGLDHQVWGTVGKREISQPCC